MEKRLLNLINQIGPGRMLPTSYDTAWLARLAMIGEPLGDRALEWLRDNQNPDGSWGAPQLFYVYDRVISTLAVMTALARCGSSSDQPRVERAAVSLMQVLPSLADDPAEKTAGFELLVPMYLDEARELNIDLNGTSKFVEYLIPLRDAKLAALPNGAINRNVTAAFSVEMAGVDRRHIVDVENLQEPNGSVARSPSATAYYATCLCPGDPAAIKYLRGAYRDGGVSSLAPADIYEPAWVIWNLMLAGCLWGRALERCKPHLDYLERAWQPNSGVAAAIGFEPEDADDTALVYAVLSQCGRKPHLDAVLYYESDSHFRTYDLETDPSVSTNIHVLGALKAAGLTVSSTKVQKVLEFLRRACTSEGFWRDKWHASPYYPTAHAIIVCADLAAELMEPAVAWMLRTQYDDGSWGFYGPSAEETAYCLQALVTWRRAGHYVPMSVIERGGTWLAAHGSPPYAPLWIAKSLNCPETIVKSAILSALILVENEMGQSRLFGVN